MKKHIEAEKGELIIVSDEGHRAIIPAKDRKHFLDSLNGCDDCINKYIQQLPMMSNYAEDGSLVPDDGDPIKKETYEQWGDRIRKMAPSLDYTKDGDYNYRGAYEAGLEPVEVDNNGVKEYHLGSRNPKTGEILKYRSHPTFNQAISEDVKMGYVPYEKDGRIYTVDRKSKEYKDLYDSGKLLGYDRVNDLYIAPDLGGATIKATKPQWMKDKEALEKEYSKDWYIDNNLPKFSRSIGVSADNMHSNSVKQYNEFINNKLAEKLLKRNPNFEKEYESHLNSGRIGYLSSQFSPKELAIIKGSSSKNKISPSFWSSIEQNLLSIGNVNPVMKLKNSNLTDEEAQKEDTPFGLLERTGELGANAVRSVFDKDYTVKQFLSGKQSDATTAEKIAFDVLNLVGAGAWGKLSKTAKLAKLEEGYQAIKGGNNLVSKLSKADEAIDVTKAGSKVLNKEEALSKLSNENKINLSETFNNLANKSKNISESLKYELNTLHKKLNPSYQKRAEKELEYANKWQEEWYNHPETKKRLQSLSDEFNTYRNQQIDEINKNNKIQRENPDNLKFGFTQEDLNRIYRHISYRTENEWTNIVGGINNKNYISTFQSKDAKLQKILKGEKRIHKGNHGISGHFLDKDYNGVRQNLVDKYSSKIKSTAIHEGNHGLTEGNLLIPKSEQEEMVKIFGKDKEIPVRNEEMEFNTYDEYLEDPTEIYARIMELREYMGKKPVELVSADEVEKLIQSGKAGDTPVDSYFFSKIQDKEKLKKLFNRLPAIAPLIGISYLQSQNQNKTKQ